MPASHILARMAGSPLLLDPRKVDAVLDVLGRKAAGEHFGLPRLPPDMGVRLAGPVAVIPVLGTLVRRSMGLAPVSGMTSYHDIESMAEDAFGDPSVRAVVLEIDSYGGEAGGVFDLAEKLRRLSLESGKPLWAVADEAACSAAYAIASAASRIYLTRTAEVGSIGVVAIHVDQSAADAMAGLAYTYIYAGRHKADGHPHAPLPDDVRQRIQQDVDLVYSQFCSLVARHRGIPASLVAATEAAVYRGAAALDAGLADRIGTLEEAIAAIQEEIQPQLTRKETSMDAPMDQPVAQAGHGEHIELTVEARLRAQMAELMAIAAQAQRLGVSVDPAQAMAQGVTPDALRAIVLEQAAARDQALDIVCAPAPVQQPAASPLVEACARFTR